MNHRTYLQWRLACVLRGIKPHRKTIREFIDWHLRGREYRGGHCYYRFDGPRAWVDFKRYRLERALHIR